MPSPKISVTVHCLCCDKATTVVGSKNAYDSYRDGLRKSADVFRNLEPNLRRTLTTLICGPCYQQ